MRTTLFWTLTSRTNHRVNPASSQVGNPPRIQVHSRRLTHPTSRLSSPPLNLVLSPRNSRLLSRPRTQLVNLAHNPLPGRPVSLRVSPPCNQEADPALNQARSHHLILRANRRSSRPCNLPRNLPRFHRSSRRPCLHHSPRNSRLRNLRNSQHRCLQNSLAVSPPRIRARSRRLSLRTSRL